MSIMTMPRPIALLKSERRRERTAEAAARGIALGAGLTVIAILAGVATFLLVQGAPALGASGDDLPLGVSSIWRLAGPLLFGSVWSALWALVLAAPVAIGTALFVTCYVRGRVAQLLATLIDLLAAVPSVVYGLWGLLVLAPILAKVDIWLAHNLGWFPLFSGEPSATGRTMLTASVVLAIMTMPIMASVAREVFARTATAEIEGAWALGATRWEMIRLALLPAARSGLVAGAMLALGRALGETMAVAMVLSSSPTSITASLITASSPNTVAGFIAQNFPEAHG
ncbi:MAG: phosphate ABC transporter permease subunit PstC, partial [Propionibacteriaceae bacterium]|nr:phosphate ABC transporter permease subunit PstC [Propionibacteriaceae bacterium]